MGKKFYDNLQHMSSCLEKMLFMAYYWKPDRTMDVQTNKEISKETDRVENNNRHRIWVAGYIIVACSCLALYFLLRYDVFQTLGTSRSVIQRLCLAGFIVSVVLVITRVIEKIIAGRSHTKKVKYNIIRLIRLLSVLLAAFILVTFLFEKWYTAAVSLGLVSLILGFALQTPISSLIGWFYIIIRTPYRIGDRIQVGQFTGDVVEISYLDTTLWEFGGDYLTNDVPSGRLIRFPNTLVLESEVYNYSWKKFPFIWNEIPFHVAYESDLGFVESTIRDTAKKELGQEMAVHIQQFKNLIQQTPVDELDIKEYPFVAFRTNANTWLEVSLTYLVVPKKAAVIRSKLIKSIVAALLTQPDRVLFPKSNAR